MQIICCLLDEFGGSPQEVVRAKNLGKAEDDVVQKAVAGGGGGAFYGSGRLLADLGASCHAPEGGEEPTVRCTAWSWD